MIAAGFGGVKARKTGRTLWTAATCRPRPEIAECDFLFSFVREETVRNSSHVLNSPRITQSRGEGIKLKYVRRFPPSTKA